MTGTGRPLVSILLVTWNRREDVRRAIASALCQTYEHIEVVVVDNASTDGTAEAIATDFPAVRVIRAERNLGCPSGRNYGFQHCRGEYIYLFDDDGWLDARAVEHVVARAESDSALAAVMSRIHVVEGGSTAYRWPVGQETPAYLGSFVGCCTLLRRRVLDSVGVFPDDFWRQGEEEDLAIRLLRAGYYCYLEPASIMYHAHSDVGRDTRGFLYYTLRNGNKTALRLWPFPWCAIRVAKNMGHAVRAALIHGQIALPTAILRDCLADISGMHGRRNPVPPEVMRLYLSLGQGPVVTLPPEELQRSSLVRRASLRR